MEKIGIEDFKRMLSVALTNIEARADEFSALDAITGDGDHGTAIVSAMRALIAGVGESGEFKQMLGDMGFNVMMETSGSTSTLLGALFLGMSDAASGSELDAQGVKKLFKGGLDNVGKQTKAKVGDKTMCDALIPAVEAIQACDSSDIAEIMTVAAKAAQEGADATVNMQAAFGRARNYGERSVGSLDAGAMSWACMFASFAEALNN